jgi:hypothetical protein
VLTVDHELVAVDVQAFLAGMQRAHRARVAGLIDASVTAYRHARELYVGPLLAGRDEDYEWLSVPIEGRLTLREALRHQERLATSRLAELLVATGRPAEAATLYAELMRDPGPPGCRGGRAGAIRAPPVRLSGGMRARRLSNAVG